MIDAASRSIPWFPCYDNIFLQQLRLITYNSNVVESEDCLDLAQILTANLREEGSWVVVDVAIDQIQLWLNRINRINRKTEWGDVDCLTPTVWLGWLALTIDSNDWLIRTTRTTNSYYYERLTDYRLPVSMTMEVFNEVSWFIVRTFRYERKDTDPRYHCLRR